VLLLLWGQTQQKICTGTWFARSSSFPSKQKSTQMLQPGSNANSSSSSSQSEQQNTQALLPGSSLLTAAAGT
jgi:hypothetical protein